MVKRAALLVACTAVLLLTASPCPAWDSDPAPGGSTPSPPPTEEQAKPADREKASDGTDKEANTNAAPFAFAEGDRITTQAEQIRAVVGTGLRVWLVLPDSEARRQADGAELVKGALALSAPRAAPITVRVGNVGVFRFAGRAAVRLSPEGFLVLCLEAGASAEPVLEGETGSFAYLARDQPGCWAGDAAGLNLTTSTELLAEAARAFKQAAAFDFGLTAREMKPRSLGPVPPAPTPETGFPRDMQPNAAGPEIEPPERTTEVRLEVRWK